MKIVRFLAEKIIIIELMLFILFFAKSLFTISIPIVDLIINKGLQYLTPIAIISLIVYIILSLLSSKLIETALGVVLGGLILYYLFAYIM